MLKSLKECCEGVDLKDIDDLKEVESTQFYQKVIEIFPNIELICNQGKQKHIIEFTRTLKHIFRTFKIYYLLIDDKFSHETLSKEAEHKICKKAKEVNLLNKNLIPLILIYHDLGRFIHKRDHPYQSYKLITENRLLKPYELTPQDELLIKKVIQYHLLFATIYTGESTFYGAYSLLNDIELIELFSKNDYCKSFIDLLEIFTFIDVLGYPYSQIYDHYLKYYNEINLMLNEILERWENREEALNIAFDLSVNWINWRLAGALRIFQFVETEPELTVDFYFQKIEHSINASENSILKNMNLEQIKSKFLKPSCKIQLKYAIVFLMILAFGKFSRSKLSETTLISDKLILFWISLSQKIDKSISTTDMYLWNVYIIGIKNWFGLNQIQLNKLTGNFIQNVIAAASFEFQEEKKEYNLYLDFNELNNLG
jgi:hypothetical protein